MAQYNTTGTEDDLTTLVCLFHHQNQAHAAISDLLKADIPAASISLIGGAPETGSTYGTTDLASLDLPGKDLDHLSEGLRNGGVVVAVESIYEHIDKVDDIFSDHHAKLIDEADSQYTAAPVAAPVAATTGETAIPIVEEELVVGKKEVDRGGVRVYRRVVEIPVEESVNLREEHVVVDRRAVDRAASDADFALGDRTIELTETAEEAVVGKSARVVEEVLVGKETAQHTETISDTLRRTEVDVEEIPVGSAGRKY